MRKSRRLKSPNCEDLERLPPTAAQRRSGGTEAAGVRALEWRGVKQAVLLACASILTLSAEDLHAQTIEQQRSEGEFVRALIRAQDANDCHLALRLIDKREGIVQSQLREFNRNRDRRAFAPNRRRTYLLEQIRGLENRRAVMSRECL
jgi:hypothetical protein